MAAFKIGTNVEFLKGIPSQYNDGEFVVYEGQRGVVYGVNNEGTENETYTIGVGLQKFDDVSPDMIVNINSSIEDKVDKYLKEKQAKKQFKDTDIVVGGSAKEKRAFKKLSGEYYDLGDIDKMQFDEHLARELIKKDNVYAKVNPVEDRDRGVSSGCSYLKTKLRSSFGAELPKGQLLLRIYVGMANYLSKATSELITTNDMSDLIDGIIKNKIKLIASFIGDEYYEQFLDYEADVEKDMSVRKQHLNELVLELHQKEEELFKSGKVPESARGSYGFYTGIDGREQIPIKIYPYGPYAEDIIAPYIEKIKAIGKYYSPVNVLLEKELNTYIKSQTGDSSINIGGVFTHAIGKRFVRYIQSNFYYDLKDAKKYEAIDAEKSALLKLEIEKKFQNIEKYKQKYDQLSSTNDYRFIGVILENESARGRSIGSNYKRFDQLTSDTQRNDFIEIFRTHYLAKIKTLENDKKLQLEQSNERPEDWSWSVKEKTQKTTSEKSDIVANKYPPLHHITRKGGILITDEDIQVETIIKRFGFKSVEFGLALKDNEAKEHIRHFLASLADLSEILNYNLIDINKKGMLSIAFASRGKGKANAHYEPARKIINISKARGGGSIAHEFMHYIDNILPSNYLNDYTQFASDTFRVASNQVENAIRSIFDFIRKKEYYGNNFNTKDLESKIPIKVVAQKHYYQLPIRRLDESLDDYMTRFLNTYPQYGDMDRFKPSYIKAYQQILHLFEMQEHTFFLKTKKSMFLVNSEAMSSDYWSRPWELFARAFETYIYDKLAKAGRENTYLVSGVYFEHPLGVYPQGKEREILFELYDDLMTAIKTTIPIGDFVPWTTERVDEYIDLDGTEKEKIKASMIADAESGEIIESTDKKAKIKQKLNELKILLENYQ